MMLHFYIPVVGDMDWLLGGIVNNMSVDDEDSLELNVQMPIEVKAKANSLLSSYELYPPLCEPLEMRLFLVVNPVYLRNLIDHKETPNLTEQQRKRLTPESLICKEFRYEWITENGSTRERDEHRGEVILSYLSYKGLDLLLRLGELEIKPQDTLQARFIYYSPGEENNYKTFPLTLHKSDPTIYMCTVDQKMLQTYSKPKIAVEITVRKEPKREARFRGIQNQGNTCYMNSTLQILYFLRPLRKTILDFQGKSSLMEAIKRVFVELLDVNDGHQQDPVDASKLLSAYGRFPDPHKQQDIHEFLLGFLDQLQTACPELKELWLGHGQQLLTSRQAQKPYNSTVPEDFNEIDLLLEDHRGNTLGQLYQSLGRLLLEEHVDDKIETDDYGKVEVTKHRQFTNLPNVIFFNLKRYKYRKDHNRLVKILTDFEYPSSINLGFLQGTPSGMDQDYVLFGVAVHRGQAYNSGHYFSFVNTSSDPENPYWVKFNDSLVHLSSTESALSFKGGKYNGFGWNREYQRFMEKKLVSQETAYLLVYIRRDKFKAFQTVPTPLPKDWLMQRRQADLKRHSAKTSNVELLILEDETGDLFGDVISMAYDLTDDEQVHQQLGRISAILGCQVATIWKVHRQRRKVKQVLNYIDLPQTPNILFGYKRGHSIPDYLLIAPKSHPVYRSLPLSDKHRLGLACVVVRQAREVIRRWQVIAKDSLDDFVAEEEKKLGKRGHVEEKDRFVYHWTDHCVINFE